MRVLGGSRPLFELEGASHGGSRLSIKVVPSSGGRVAGGPGRLPRVECHGELRRATPALASATAEAVCIHDGRVIVDINESMIKAFGYPPGEIIGLRVDTLLGARAWRGTSRATSGGTVSIPSTRYRAPQGRRYLLRRGRLQAVGAEGLHGLTIRDVTAHRTTAQAFHDSEERFRLISELSSEGLVLTEGGTIFHVNEA